jgi:Cu/Ag efflux pump CusA
VRVRYPDAVRFDPARLAQTPVRGAEGRLTPLAALAHPVPAGPQSILWRENLRQMSMVTAHLEGRDLGSAVKDVKDALAKIKLPVGYSVEVGGLYESRPPPPAHRPGIAASSSSSSRCRFRSFRRPC